MNDDDDCDCDDEPADGYTIGFAEIQRRYDDESDGCCVKQSEVDRIEEMLDFHGNMCFGLGCFFGVAFGFVLCAVVLWLGSRIL